MAKRWTIPAPLSWDECLRIIEAGTLEEIVKLGRSEEGWDQYMAFKEQVLKEYKTMTDYIKSSVYKCATRLDEDGKKVAETEMPPESRGTPLWKANDFPYWFEPGVEHHIVWCTERLAADAIQAAIDANRGPQYETAYWINPEVVQSIPELWHAHVLSRPKPMRQ